MKSESCRFSQCLYFSSASFARKVERLANQTWKELDLSPSHAYVLIMSLEQPGIYAGLVAEQMKLSPSTITRLIEKLELNGWLFRHQDGKNTRLWPTDKAKDKHTRMIEIIQGFYSKYTELIGEEDSQQLVNLMNQLEAKL